MPTPPEADAAPAQRYDGELAASIERRWQERWSADRTFVVPRTTEGDKFFLMDMFPYPSGSGLHVGHPLGYIATDVYGRYLRMTGKVVLHTLGFDAYGLPAEQYAVQTGTHPRTTTEANIARFREQIGRLGLAHDQTRSVATTDPGFYRWTQWIFLQIYNSYFDEEANAARPVEELIASFASGERRTPDGRAWADLTAAERASVIDGHRLAYRAHVPVNWCPGLGTVLANEEVTSEGRSERGNFPVYRRELTQWMMRITAYADRLLEDLDALDWPESVKTMQRNWIGRSTGATVNFPVVNSSEAISVFTTRPDTLFGATYMVVAPESPLVDRIVAPKWPEDVPEAWTGGAPTPADAVAAYRKEAAALSERARTAEARDKTGVFIGAYAVNPANGARIPVFVADYVLAGYGTGAIMAVPAHDQRDFEFARAFDLPIKQVVSRPDEVPVEEWVEAWSGEGTGVNSANDRVSLDGLAVEDAKARTIEFLEAAGAGEGTVTYKLRDWLFSRQRYWGEPFPIVYDDEGLAHPLPDSMLPVELPEVDDYAPATYDPDDADTEPQAPLDRAKHWVTVELDLGDGPKRYRRETNTMPQWAGSCWYELRYLDPDNDKELVAPDLERFWMGPRSASDPGGVDLYVGGQEHAVLHLLYSRFWHKVLFDLGHVSSSEPFRGLFNQGYIQAYSYLDARGVYVPAEEVEEDHGTFTWKGQKVERRYGKMGKSLRNAVTPDEIADRYGADTLRIYEMSMGPLDVSRVWDTRAVVGSQRFLQRVWRNLLDEQSGEATVTDSPADTDTLRLLHRTIDAVRGEVDALRLNTAIAKLIELNNHLTGLSAVPLSVAEPLVLMLAPFAPHVAEELWSRMGHSRSLAFERFPTADPELLVAETVSYPVQVNGKVRGTVVVAAGAPSEEVQATAVSHANVAAHLEGKQIKKVVVVPDKIVNIVAR